MARKRQLQTTFIAGELAPELALRVDTKQYANGAKSLLNRRCLIGGGTSRRPGTRIMGNLSTTERIIEFVFNENEQYIIGLFPFGMLAFTPQGSFAGSAGAPWDTTNIQELDWMQSGNTIIFTHFSFAPYVIERTSAVTWSGQNIVFFPSGDRIEQPYFNFSPRGTTLTPSGYTGSITVTTSTNWFTSDHVGQRFRYLGRELQIDSIVSPTTANATVIEQLPPTFVLGVDHKEVFTPGEVVAGSDSGAKGVIYQVSSTTSEVSVYGRQASVVSTTGPGGTNALLSLANVGGDATVPQVSLQTFTVGETLVGPAGTAKITGVTTVGPAAVTDWEEALFTPGNGFPSCVALHRNRLCFAGHPKVPNLLLASRLGNIYSFNIGDGSDADAIAVTIGDAAAAEIRQLFSSDQLLLGTDKGLYYVPEGMNAPFRPSSMAFIAFGSPWPISGRLKMRAFDDGVIAVSGNTVIKAKGTGDSNKTWVATEVSILSPHLLNEPYDMAVTANWEGGPERYCIFNNKDGTLAVMMLVEQQDIRNFVPWTTVGFFRSVAVVNKTLFASVLRGPTFVENNLEQFLNFLTLDATKLMNTEADLASIPALFPGRDISVVTTSGYSLGVYPLEMDDVPIGPYFVGQDYVTRIETLPAVIDDPRGSNAGEMARITEAYVYTDKSARFTGNGYEKQAYLVNEDANQPPPLRTGPQRLKFLGWKRNPTITITQPDPLPLTILAIKEEVCW